MIELQAYDLSRRLAAETLGTALLVAAVVGPGIMAERLTKDVALALLGNTLPTGAILVVLITWCVRACCAPLVTEGPLSTAVMSSECSRLFGF